MVEINEQYFECPTCGFLLTFRLKGDKYISYCPFCQNILEMAKEEYERDDFEVYFEKDL